MYKMIIFACLCIIECDKIASDSETSSGSDDDKKRKRKKKRKEKESRRKTEKKYNCIVLWYSKLILLNLF